MYARLRRLAKRSWRELSLECHGWTLTTYAIRAACASLLLLASCFGVRALLHSLLSLPEWQGEVTSALAANLSLQLQEDLHLHAAEHWRMLLPSGNPDSDLEAFLTSLVPALRARPLGKPCLDFALGELAPWLDRESLWLEFGVWRGRSLDLLGRKSSALGRTRKVFGFDSFRGLPETWRTAHGVFDEAWEKRWTRQGAFDLGGQPPEWFVDMTNVDFVVGWFNESLPAFLEREPGKVSLLHIDSDLYSSALTVLQLVGPRLRHGAVIIFDELVNYPGFRDGEVRALHEWLQSPGFLAAGHTGIQVIGYRGPDLLTNDAELREALHIQRGEGRRYPQDAVFRVW
mmetsp:Transcript_25487/g.49970  ORF Transcript_25487/g.49970 Transcript_25487/m.49970 type:complete len:344 (+) Transcript_25487:69-1100(+)